MAMNFISHRTEKAPLERYKINQNKTSENIADLIDVIENVSAEK